MSNLHATGVVLGTWGLLVIGASGSGKSTLALALLDACTARGGFARLVADDQLFVTALGGRLVASAPPAIAGLVEIHGFGPRPAPFLAAAVIDACCMLVPARDAPRLQEPETHAIAGMPIPVLRLPERAVRANVAALLAWKDAGFSRS